MEYSEIEKIKTKQDFIEFLLALKKDHQENLESWENPKIECFLEAMAAWVGDMEGFYKNQNLPIPNPDWRVFADILRGGKVYE